MTKPVPITSARLEHVFHGFGAAVTGQPLPSNQAEFEAAVIESIMLANPDVAEVLRSQLAASRIVKRCGTGAGCHVFFAAPVEAPALPASTNFPLSSALYLLRDVGGPSCDAETAKTVPPHHRDSGVCGALLLYYDGYISYLDCHSYGEGRWPEMAYDFWFFPPERSAEAK